MILRQSLVGLAAGSMMLVAGCPLDGLGGLGGPFDYAIPDGTYGGKLILTATMWQNGEFDDQSFDEWETTRIFKTGDLVNKVTNDWFYPGDQDTLDFGSLQIAREVYEVEQFDWGYHIIFDVTATWGDIPMTGTQHADFTLENDGTVSVEDTIELVSRTDYDGGAWEMELDIQGNLSRSSVGSTGGNGGNSGGNGGNANGNGGTKLPPWFDQKSGKTRR